MDLRKDIQIVAAMWGAFSSWLLFILSVTLYFFLSDIIGTYIPLTIYIPFVFACIYRSLVVV